MVWKNVMFFNPYKEQDFGPDPKNTFSCISTDIKEDIQIEDSFC